MYILFSPTKQKNIRLFSYSVYSIVLILSEIFVFLLIQITGCKMAFKGWNSSSYFATL